MSSPALLKNAGAWVTPVFGFAAAAVTAGGAGDNTEINGAAIDLNAYGTRFRSAKLAAPVTATLGSGETVQVLGNFQDSADGTNWSDYKDALAATTVATGPSGGGARTGVATLEVDITGARRYIRVQATPNLSRAGTDTASFGPGLVLLCGPQELPAPY